MEHIRQLQTHPWLSPSYRDQEPFAHHQRAYNSKSCETFVVRQQHAICWYHTAWICTSNTHRSERTRSQYLCIVLVRAAYMTTASPHNAWINDENNMWFLWIENAWWSFASLLLLQMQGVHYFVRVSAFNVKGWGPPRCSTPASAATSSEYTFLRWGTCHNF